MVVCIVVLSLFTISVVSSWYLDHSVIRMFWFISFMNHLRMKRYAFYSYMSVCDIC